MADEVLFGIAKGDATYPTSATIKFGSEYANQDFVVPMAKFVFYDAKGEMLSGSNAPTIYVRLGGTFNTTLTNAYQEVAGIMGSPTGTSIFEGETGKTLGRFGDSFITAIQKQIVSGVAGATGYIASAGQSGKAQVEFLQRKMLNNFQQLIYQGPSYRRFQLPFNMRPTDQQEAERMLEIISSFRVASSPRTGAQGTIGETIDTFGRNDNLADRLTEKPERSGFPEGDDGQAQYDAALAQWNLDQSSSLSDADESALDDLISKSGSVLYFGYPDMCKFELVLVRPNADEITTLFKSDFCMIESVSVDYGAQNKMTFFDGGGNSTQYFPTDVNLTISLKEATLITAPKASEEYLRGTVIL